MLRMLLFSLLLLPLAEIAGLIALGRVLGLWLALAWLGLAGLAGLRILRWQGRRSLQQFAGFTPESPGAADLLNALLVSAAGLLLLLPGPFSDAMAVVLLLPPLRRGLARWGGPCLNGCPALPAALQSQTKLQNRTRLIFRAF